MSERPTAARSSRGYLYEKGKPNTPIEQVELETEFVGEQKLHDAHPRAAPSRRRRRRSRSPVACCRWCPVATGATGWVTRVSEGMTEWRWGDRVGYGMSEYLDHLQKGEA